MTYDEMNSFILNYIDNDITGRAIMLTGEWGSGKSYYIKNTLKPFLEKKDHKCVIVSLYGLSDISEISKAIYFELRSFKFKKKHEVLTTAGVAVSLVPKTIFNAMTSHIGYDIGRTSDRQFQKVYKSIDLSKKVLILEDIERTQIDILELLGYVNNMCENDGVKVLLVTNESELLTTYEKIDEQGKTTKNFTNDAIAYKREKEKSIGDTIHFSCEMNDAIKAIIRLFNNNSLSKLENDECIDYILEIMRIRKCHNLRTFLFACQKTVDIFEKAKKDDFDFNKNIFYSIIAFSIMLKNGNLPNWKGNDLVSSDLGISKYPLYRFCYNYIRWQEFSLDEVEVTLRAHKKMILFDRHGSRSDSDLNVIYYLYEHTEQEVNEALHRIEVRLDDPENIPFYDYRKLAFYLVSCHTVLNYDYSNCKAKMIRNITGKSLDIDEEMLFLPFSDFNNENEKTMYHAFIDDLRAALNQSPNDIFSYSPEDLNDFYNQLVRNKGNYIKNHKFLSEFEMDRIANMLFECSPAQLQDFRGILFSVYRHADSHDFLEEDISAMESLKHKVQQRITDYSEITDKIALQQYRWIIENLDEFITNLSR